MKFPRAAYLLFAICYLPCAAPAPADPPVTTHPAQQQSAALTIYSGITPSSNVQSFLGAANFNAGLNLLLPSQGGNSGKVLKTNGGSVSWQTPGGGTLHFVADSTARFGGTYQNGDFVQEVGAAETITITAVDDTGGNYNNTAFTVTGRNAGTIRPWFNEDGGGTDPGGAGAAIEVDVSTGDTAITIGTNIAGILSSEFPDDYTVVDNGDGSVTLTALINGAIAPPTQDSFPGTVAEDTPGIDGTGRVYGVFDSTNTATEAGFAALINVGTIPNAGVLSWDAAGGLSANYPVDTNATALTTAVRDVNGDLRALHFIGKLVGSATNDSAAAGQVGEFVSSALAVGSATSLTTATAKNVTSISLTAGDWDVEGNVNFTASSATLTATVGGINTTTGTLPTDGSEVYSGLQTTTASEINSVTLPRKRVSLSGTTTVYLVGKATFSAGTISAFGVITARRVR